jgi:hypothetical protein
MTENEKNIIRRLNNMTAPSDNTRVVSPYRIKYKAESAPAITRAPLPEKVRRIQEAGRKQKQEFDRIEREEYEAIAKLKAEKEAKLAKEETERKERERIRAIEDRERKIRAEKQRQYELNKEADAKRAKEEEELKDKLYESEYQQWKKDVLTNPDDYAVSTRAAVQASN